LASGVVQISAGNSHACALTTSGGVKCWGLNDTGALGDGTTTDRSTPVNVSGLSSGVAQISSGFGHTCALTTSGRAECWGSNGSGTLGDGTRTDRLTPVTVTGLSSGVAQISAGIGQTCAVTTSGRAECWGWNAFGQLGDGTTTNRRTPVTVSGLFPGQFARSDALISDGDGFVGGNVYSDLAAGETLTERVRPGATARFSVKVQNDGDARDTIAIGGVRPAKGFALTVDEGGRDVTSSYLAGSLANKLAPGSHVDLTLKITVKLTSPSGQVGEVLVTTTSGNDVTQKDAVLGKVRVR
jgi:alpha-tubulin suppressor-like RCC1 family protein